MKTLYLRNPIAILLVIMLTSFASFAQNYGLMGKEGKLEIYLTKAMDNPVNAIKESTKSVYLRCHLTDAMLKGLKKELKAEGTQLRDLSISLYATKRSDGANSSTYNINGISCYSGSIALKSSIYKGPEAFIYEDVVGKKYIDVQVNDLNLIDFVKDEDDKLVPVTVSGKFVLNFGNKVGSIGDVMVACSGVGGALGQQDLKETIEYYKNDMGYPSAVKDTEMQKRMKLYGEKNFKGGKVLYVSIASSELNATGNTRKNQVFYGVKYDDGTCSEKHVWLSEDANANTLISFNLQGSSEMDKKVLEAVANVQ